MINLENKTIAEVDEEIEKIAQGECAEKILEVFKTLPDPNPYCAPTETAIVNARRAPLINALARLEHKPAAPIIFEDTQKTRLNSEITAGIKALGDLGYVEAFSFIQKVLERLKPWHRDYSTHRFATNVDIVEEQIKVAKDALDALHKL